MGMVLTEITLVSEFMTSTHDGIGTNTGLKGGVLLGSDLDCHCAN